MRRQRMRGQVAHKGPGREGEGGSGSILAIAVLAGVLALTAGILPLGAVFSAQRQAANSADAAALAAADVAVGIAPGDPCSAARMVATANGVQLASCTLDGTEATVQTVVRRGGFVVSSRATAGSPPSDAAVRNGNQ